ncbi:microcystin-dependent protein [Bradyrhizobium yuanmingense]|uniref:phage tail protein n=1 Tax=Bradyrhizobium yuanmingense TaxID=108015 RepID=UPI003515A962
MTLYKWSQTASADATADSTINWAEGQSPSSINDSARGMMAAIAKYRDDVAGAIVTTGSSTAYAVNTYQVFQSLSQLNGQVIAFTPHATNGAGSPNITLNVDGLGAKSIQLSPGVELPAGTLIQGSPYAALYNASNGVFYLHNFFGNPYLIPIGGSIDFWGSTSPNSSFVLPYGQAISRTTYATLFSLLGTTYGSGDGSSTFNIPDLRGRVVAGKDDMGGSAASRLTNSFITGPTTLGGTGGSQSRQLATENLPPYTPAGTITNGAISISHNAKAGASSSGGGGFSVGGDAAATITASQAASTFTGTAQGGTNTGFGILQPTIIANKLLRII